VAAACVTLPTPLQLNVRCSVVHKHKTGISLLLLLLLFIVAYKIHVQPQRGVRGAPMRKPFRLRTSEERPGRGAQLA